MDNKNGLYEEALVKSAEIDEIIGQPPHWLIRWGLTVFFAMLILVFGLSYFIEYPETVTAPFILHTNQPAIPVKAGKSGKLISCLKNAGDRINKNDTLLFWRENGSTELHTQLSPADGKIELGSPLFNGQALSQGQLLFFIIPQTRAYYASVYVDASLITKVKIGQHVILDLRAYPRQDYGNINGIVGYKSSVNTQKGHYVSIDLSNGLKSDIGKILPVRDGLNGTAEIVIAKQKLIYKFIGGHKF